MFCPRPYRGRGQRDEKVGGKVEILEITRRYKISKNTHKKNNVFFIVAAFERLCVVVVVVVRRRAPHSMRSSLKTPQTKKPVDFDNALLRTELAKPAQDPKSELPLADWRKLDIGRSPSQKSREGHSSNIIHSTLYIFGGLEFGVRSNTMLALNLEELKWSVIHENGDELAPRARCYHSSASWGNVIFFQGGEGIESAEEKVERSGRFGSLLRTRGSARDTGTVSTPAKSSRKSHHHSNGHHRHHHESPEKPLPSHHPEKVETVHEEGRPNAILLDDLHAYDTVNEKWTEVLSSLAPLPTKGHTMVSIYATPPSSETEEEQSQSLNLSAVPYLICFGGTSQYSSTKTDQMSFCKVESALQGEGVWEVCTPSGDGPSGRSAHTMTVLSKFSFAIFGGVDSKDEFLNDLFIYDARAHTWSTIKESIGDLPPKMSAHAAVAHEQKTSGGMQVSSKILVYGGSCMVPDDSVTVEGDPVGGYRETTSHDAYMFDVDEARWLKLTHGPIYPNPRRGHSMAVMDGWRPSWFEPENWGFKARYGVLAPNMPKVAHIDDPDDDGHPPVFAVVYGGINSLYCNSDTWLLDMKPFVVAKLEPIMPYPLAKAADPSDPANMTPLMKKRAMMHSQSMPAISFAGDFPPEGIDLGEGGGFMSPQKLLRERKESEHLIHTLRKETKDAQTQFKQELERRRGAEAERDDAISEAKTTREDLQEREAQLRDTETKLLSEQALSSELRDLRDEALHLLQLMDQTRPLDALLGAAAATTMEATGVENEEEEEGDKEEEGRGGSGAAMGEKKKAGNKTGGASVAKATQESPEGAVITGDKGQVREVDLLQKDPDDEEEEEEEEGGGGGGAASEPSEEMARSLKDIWENDSYIKMVRNATFQETFRRMEAPVTDEFGEQFLADFKLKYKSVARDLLRWEAGLFGPPKTVEQMTATTPRLSVANNRLDRQQMIQELEDLFEGKTAGSSIAMASTHVHPRDFVNEYETVHLQAEKALEPEKLMRAYEDAFEKLRDPAVSRQVFESRDERLKRVEFVARFQQLGLCEAETMFVALRSVAKEEGGGTEVSAVEDFESATVGHADLHKALNIIHPLDAAVRAGAEARKAILDFATEATRQEKLRLDAIAAAAAAEAAVAADAAAEESEDDEEEEEEEEESNGQSEFSFEDVSASEPGTEAEAGEGSGGAPEAEAGEGADAAATAAATTAAEDTPIADELPTRPIPSSKLGYLYEAQFLKLMKEQEGAAAAAEVAAADADA